MARGRAAFAEFWRGTLELPALDFRFEPQAIKVAEAGDLAYDIGTYSLGYGAAEDRVQDRGKYLVVWEKVGGEWKVMVDIDNSDLPAP
jgi:ketosteroid isomerase-like protein